MFLLTKIDNFLNAVTMYRLVLYGLRTLTVVAILFGFLGILPYSGWAIIASLLTMLAACWPTNKILAKLFGVTTNYESIYISMLILFLLLPPSLDIKQLATNFLAGVIAMASKYILAINKKHLFNPAAFGVWLVSIFGITSAIWWGAGEQLLPFTIIIGLLIVRKIRRFLLLFSFFVASTITISFFNLQHGMNLPDSIIQVFIGWPVVFLGTIMLTEPLTSPGRKHLQIIYGALVGVLLGLQFHIGPLFSSPEFTLLVGNLFAYFVSAKEKLFLQVKEIKKLSPNIYEIIFAKDPSFKFLAGQYMEWTLRQKHTDARANRRYFTIASSPQEEELRLGIRYSTPSSTFKETLIHLLPGGKIVASQLGGDFVLPKDRNKKLVFIAGGIGVTPFRSILKYLIDAQEKRDIVLFYSNTQENDIVYEDIFDQAAKTLGMKIYYVLTDKEKIPQGWKGLVGRLSNEIIDKEIPDYRERTFYLSGPNVMVNGYKKILSQMGVPQKQIKTDYFPGY